MLNDCLYESNNEFDILICCWKNKPENFFCLLPPGGADSRLRKDVATYHFYVDDYRFEAIWKRSDQGANQWCKSVGGSNLSVYDTTPIAYGLQQIYKKRWISRYFQKSAVSRCTQILNVSVKFKEYNKLGLPKGITLSSLVAMLVGWNI